MRVFLHQLLIIFKLILLNGGWGISYEIAIRWMPLNLTDDKSTLVLVMAWCCQATSHYLSQCWPRSLSSYMVSLGLLGHNELSQTVTHSSAAQDNTLLFDHGTAAPNHPRALSKFAGSAPPCAFQSSKTIWNFQDRSTILPKFIYSLEGKLARLIPVLPVKVRGPALMFEDLPLVF